MAVPFYILVINTYNEYSPPPQIPDITKEHQDDYAVKLAKKAIQGRIFITIIAVLNIIIGILSLIFCHNIILSVLSITFATQIVKGHPVCRWIYCAFGFFGALLMFALSIENGNGIMLFFSIFYLLTALLIVVNKNIDAYYEYLRPKTRR